MWNKGKNFFCYKKIETFIIGGVKMNKAVINLQDIFLNHVRKERTPIVIFLVNGFQLKGVVKGFDNYTIILESEGKQQMVYKHAISTLMPQKPIAFSFTDKTNEDNK